MNNLVEVKNNNIITIIRGMIISCILTIILLFAFSIVLTYTNISENTIPPAIIIINIISILTGTSISAVKLNKNGIVYGGIIGLLYMLIIYFISSISRFRIHAKYL